MTTLQEKLEGMAGAMRTIKEQWVASKPENTDLPIHLHFWRGDHLIATVVCPLDRDIALQAGSMAAAGFNADTMCITFEGYQSNLQESPITGKPWRPQEMQYVAQTHPDALDRGWVIEGLTTTMHERGGEYGFSSQAFRIKEDTVHWEEAKNTFLSSEEGGAAGYMFAYLQHAMTRPRITDLIEEQGVKSKLMTELIKTLDEEARYFHMDAATGKALVDKDLAVSVMLAAEVGTERAKWITERYGDQL